MDRVVSALGRESGCSPTRETPLPGARAVEIDDPGDAVQALAALPADLHAAMTASLIRESPELARPLAAGCPVAAVEVIYAMRYEMAMTVADFIRRRIALSWRHPRYASVATVAAARLMAAELGWGHAREQAEIEACNRIMRATG